MPLKQVKIFEWKRARDKDGNELKNEFKQIYNVKIRTGVGLFHRWGCDYEEFESGPGNYSTAIVEMEDGTIKNVPCEMVQFIK